MADQVAELAKNMHDGECHTETCENQDPSCDRWTNGYYREQAEVELANRKAEQEAETEAAKASPEG
jgi:hypothetical protein